MSDLNIPVGHEKQAFWVSGVNKTQLLVNMPSECAEITADATLIYWPWSCKPFILNHAARQQFILFLSGF